VCILYANTEPFYVKDLKFWYGVGQGAKPIYLEEAKMQRAMNKDVAEVMWDKRGLVNRPVMHSIYNTVHQY
jgi:hypothetical protein